MCKYKQKNTQFPESIAVENRPTQIQSYTHKYVQCVGMRNALIYCLHVGYISTPGVWITCTYRVDCEAEREIKQVETDDILTICCILSPSASHHVVWLEVTNKILSAQPYFNLLCICSACPHLFFWRFCSFISFHLISPVITAALLSLSFHEWSVGRWMIDTGGLAALVQRGAGSMRRHEMIEVAYDKRIGDETRPFKGTGGYSCLKGSLFIF